MLIEQFPEHYHVRERVGTPCFRCHLHQECQRSPQQQQKEIRYRCYHEWKARSYDLPGELGLGCE